MPGVRGSVRADRRLPDHLDVLAIFVRRGRCRVGLLGDPVVVVLL